MILGADLHGKEWLKAASDYIRSDIIVHTYPGKKPNDHRILCTELGRYDEIVRFVFDDGIFSACFDGVTINGVIPEQESSDGDDDEADEGWSRDRTVEEMAEVFKALGGSFVTFDDIENKTVLYVGGRRLQTHHSDLHSMKLRYEISAAATEEVEDRLPGLTVHNRTFPRSAERLPANTSVVDINTNLLAISAFDVFRQLMSSMKGGNDVVEVYVTFIADPGATRAELLQSHADADVNSYMTRHAQWVDSFKSSKEDALKQLGRQFCSSAEELSHRARIKGTHVYNELVKGESMTFCCLRVGYHIIGGPSFGGSVLGQPEVLAGSRSHIFSF